MAASTLKGDYVFTGTVTIAALNAPASSITSSQISGVIDADKLERRQSVRYSQLNGANNVAARTVVKIMSAAGTLLSVQCRNTTAASGTDKTTVDVKKNGSSILTAPIDLNLAAGTAVQSSSSFTSAALADGDVLEVVLTLTGANVGQGVAVQVDLDENPA